MTDTVEVEETIVVETNNLVPDPQEDPQEEAEQTDQVENEPDAKEETKDDAPNPSAKPSRYQKRIDRLTKKAAEAERKAAELEEKLKKFELDPDNFDSFADYEAAKEEKPKEPKKDFEYEEALENVSDSFSEYKEKYSDFDEVISAEDLPITREMVIALADSENAGDIAYFLGKNKQEALRIAQLSPIKQAKEIGLIEARLLSKPTKKTTKAPDPISPLKGSEISQKPIDKMSFSEYEAYMNEKAQKRQSVW